MKTVYPSGAADTEQRTQFALTLFISETPLLLSGFEM